MNRLLAGLRLLVPGTLMALAFALLTATGMGLRWSPRFASIVWGVTEMVHVWFGWGLLVLTGAYLVHHLARTWGPWTTRQRLLGIALTGALAVALLSGVWLVTPGAAPPRWVRPAHFGSTWALVATFVLHSAVGWRRWLRQTWRDLRHGPSPASAAQADHGDGPEEQGDGGAGETEQEPERPVDESDAV